MSYLLAGCLLLVVLMVAAKFFVQADPATLVKFVRYSGGILGLLATLFLVLTGRWIFALFLGPVSLTLLRRGWRGYRQSAKSRGQSSTVRTAALEMELDHESGHVDGTVLAGQFEGQNLNSLNRSDLSRLYGDIRSDADSIALLEAYLDRRFPGWRENIDKDDTSRVHSAASSSPMPLEEAYQILGLSSGASSTEIREAHRRLMKSVHPDSGGSTFLAAKINEAKDTLLSTHY
ncbi:MAG: DnaJ domain-containing protein [Cohaesibacteraceae bacterium]|nr:DnaJ domain-containing protein [Cohaesibacteraceae bacterium]